MSLVGVVLHAQSVVTTVPVGNLPGVVAVNTVTNKIYVANTGSSASPGNTVSVIDGASNTVDTTITVGDSPQSIDINTVSNKIYVANTGDNTVSVIDGADNSVTTIPVVTASSLVKFSLVGVAVNPTTNKIYVPYCGYWVSDGGVSGCVVAVIDGASNSVALVLTGADSFYSVAVDTVTNKVFVANSGFGYAGVLVFDGATNTAMGNVATAGASPTVVAVNTVTNKIYANVYGGNAVSVIDGATNNVAMVAVGNDPGSIAVNTVTNKVYVVNTGDNTVSVIDGESNSVKTVSVGLTPAQVAVDMTTNKVYVTNTGDGTVSVIDGATNSVKTVTVGSNPAHVAVNSVTNMVYVTNDNYYGAGSVSVISGTGSSSTPPASGFTISVSPTSVTASAGGTATYTINVNSVAGSTYNDAVALSVSGQPSDATVSFSPTSVTPGETSTLTIKLPASTSSKRGYSPMAFALLLLPVMFIGKARNLRIRGLLAAVLALVVTAGVIGCGGGDKNGGGTRTSPGTYTLTITGNDASHKATATLVVQ
ncbi:MAG: YncE family protein [Acidobacteriaceae bacterium]|nr:YncE family protein [Acidobacteriaceae bacterium]